MFGKLVDFVGEFFYNYGMIVLCLFAGFYFLFCILCYTKEKNDHEVIRREVLKKCNIKQIIECDGQYYKVDVEKIK